MPFSVLALHTLDKLRYLIGLHFIISRLLEPDLPFKYGHGPKVRPGAMELVQMVAPEGSLCWSRMELC